MAALSRGSQRRRFYPGKAAAVVSMSLLAMLVASSALAATTITVAHRTEREETVWMEWVEREFERRHPDIQIERIAPGGGGDFLEKLTVLWLGGSFPDVFYGTNDKRVYIRNGWTKDLTPYIQRDKNELDLKDFFPGQIDIWSIDGKQHGLPISISGRGMFYNYEAMAIAGLKPPPADWNTDDWSWSTFVEYARKLTKLDDTGRAVQFGTSLMGKGVAPEISWTFGGDYLTPESYALGVPRGSALFSPQNIEGFKASTEILHVHRVAPGGPVPWAGGSGDAFMGGRLAIEWTGWWKVRNYINTDLPFSFGFAPPPKAVTRQSTLFNDPWFMFSETRSPDAAWEFIKFGTGKEVLNKYGEMVGMPPARRSAFDTYLRKIAERSGTPSAEILGSFLGSVEHGRHTEEKIAYFGGTIKKFVEKQLDPMLKGQESVESALEKAHKQLNVFIEDLMKK